MRLAIIILGEVILLGASVLVFRSAWTMLDQYLGYSHLEILLIIGLILTVVGLILINYEIKCQLDKKKDS